MGWLLVAGLLLVGALITLVVAIAMVLDLFSACSSWRSGPAEVVFLVVILTGGVAWTVTVVGLVRVPWPRKVLVAALPAVALVTVSVAAFSIGQVVSDRLGGNPGAATNCM